MKLERWEEIIIDSTNEKYALAMILKFREYRKKHPGVDVESIAVEFSTLKLNQKRDWALHERNEQSIVKTCRVQRKIKRDADWERYISERDSRNQE
jgi:hypothetical protein